MTCSCANGWICEQHTDSPWPHDDCAGPGMQCPNPSCPFWAVDPPLARKMDISFIERDTDDDPPR